MESTETKISTEIEATEDSEITEMINQTLEGTPTYFIVNSEEPETSKQGVNLDLIGEPIQPEIETAKQSATPLQQLNTGLKPKSNMQIVIEPSKNGGAPTARLVRVSSTTSGSDKPIGTKIKVLTKPSLKKNQELPAELDTLPSLAGINTSEVSIEWKPSGSSCKTSGDTTKSSSKKVSSFKTVRNTISSGSVTPEVSIKWRPTGSKASKNKSKDYLENLKLLKDLNSSNSSIDDVDMDLNEIDSFSNEDSFFDSDDDEFKTDDSDDMENIIDFKYNKNLNLKKFFKEGISNKTLLEDNASSEKNKDDEANPYVFGKPYVLLAAPCGDPITCYVASQQGSKGDQYVATASQTLPPQVVNSLSQEITSPPRRGGMSETKKKDMEKKLEALRRELEQTKAKLMTEKRNAQSMEVLKDKLGDKNNKIQTLYKQRSRLTKRLQEYISELANTQKALQIVESKAVLWNDTILSDLGKLIFKMHCGKNKRLLFDSKAMAAKAPPEVKGFVITLFMTSPKAYQLVRNCFNGLPPPSTVSKWLHGERVGDPNSKIPRVITPGNEILLNETFTRVIDTSGAAQGHPQGHVVVEYSHQDGSNQDVEMVETQQDPGQAPTDKTNENEVAAIKCEVQHETTHQDENGEHVIAETEEDVEMITAEPGTIYYVLDEKGNVTGQLAEPPPDIIFTSEFVGTVEGYGLAEEPHHEIVIG